MPVKRIVDHNIRCPHCNSDWMVKNGKDRGKQTFICRQCNHRHTPSAERHFYPEKTRQQAVLMYAEGISVSAIGRILNVKTGTIYSWIKKTSLGKEGA